MLVVRQVPVPLPTLASLGPASSALLLLIPFSKRLLILCTLLQRVNLTAISILRRLVQQERFHVSQLHVTRSLPMLFYLREMSLAMQYVQQGIMVKVLWQRTFHVPYAQQAHTAFKGLQHAPHALKGRAAAAGLHL